MSEIDPYQLRYEAHQARKKEVLVEIIKERHSNRRFSSKEVPLFVIDDLIEQLKFCESSCDRQAIQTRLVTERDKKDLLSGLAVGGTGWIHRAPAILLVFADPVAYKAGDEINYMPYLDAGVVIHQLYLSATAMGLHCAYANPNIREMNKEHFHKIFGDGIYCGAFAFGYPLEETEA